MNAYKIDKHIICADVPDEAKNFFLYEVGEPLSADVEMMEWDCVVPCENGENKTIRDITTAYWMNAMTGSAWASPAISTVLSLLLNCPEISDKFICYPEQFGI
jgi:hypothetical protein